MGYSTQTRGRKGSRVNLSTRTQRSREPIPPSRPPFRSIFLLQCSPGCVQHHNSATELGKLLGTTSLRGEYEYGYTWGGGPNGIEYHIFEDIQ